MRIKSIRLEDYILFKESDISQLEVVFTSSIQIIIGPNGSGKAQPHDSLIKTPSGWTRMGDLTLQSKVVTPDGGTSNVIGIFPQGKKNIYRVTFVDGRSTECCDDHLWKIYNVFWEPKETRWRVHTLKEIRLHMACNPSSRAGIFVQLPEPEIKPNVYLPIDPYVLGVILGDGTIHNGNITISKPDQFIKDEVSRLLTDTTEVSKWRAKNGNKKYHDAYSIKRKKAGSYIKNKQSGKYTNEIALSATKLGLNNKRSWEKFIPEIYMNGSTEQKLSLIQGLMDTDGTVGKPSKGRSGIPKSDGSGSVQFCTTSEVMAKQVQELIWSLGGICKIYVKEPFYTYKGEKLQGRTAYILNIRYKNAKDLFRTPIKRNKLGTNQYSDRLRLRIESISYVGDKEAQCIMIDHPDHLYITDDYIVTHNSSLLKMLSAYHTTRSLFGKNGLKSLVIENEGEEYKLETDFSKASSPHLFFKGDDEQNLNIGRTTDTQKELISEMIGITPFIDDLIMNRYNFPQMKPAARKELIMSINPDKIGFVQILLKKVSSQVRSCKNNLSRLQSRKIHLEQEFLSEESMASILKEKDDVNKDIDDFQKYMTDIEVGLRSLPTSVAELSYDFKNIIKSVRNCRYQLVSLPHVERDDRLRSSMRDKLIGQIAAVDQKITLFEEELITSTNALNEMEIKYRELAPTEDLGDIDRTISNLEMERDKLTTSQPLFEMSQEELNHRFEEWNTLQERLFIFNSCDIPLYSRKKRSRREQVLENMKYRKSSLEMKLSDLRTQFETLSKRHSMSPSDIPSSPCAKEKCPLYSHFMGEYQNTESQRQHVSKTIKRLTHKQKRIDILISGLNTYFHRSESFHNTIFWLVSYAQGNPVLHNLLREMDILIVLKNNPNTILTKLKNEYDHIEQWLKLKSILSDLDTAYSLRKRLVSTENVEIVSLVSSMENTKKSLYGLRNKIEVASKNKHILNQSLLDINTYDSLKMRIMSFRDQYNEIVKELSDHHEKDSLNFLKSQIFKIRSESFFRLTELEKIIRYQGTLRFRYEEEVLSELSKIEKEMKDLEQIEKALILIPKESIIGFLNSVFTQANTIIESIWTIPLYIEPLTIEDPLNYEFYVSGDNESIREMSDCSEGQTEIIALAINLALRIRLNHLDMPLALDEVGRALDEKHKERLIIILKELTQDKIISQLFLVSHHALIHEGFSENETFVIRDSNVMVPEVYNQHVTFN